MTRAPWWTDADQAELNVAIWELVCVLEHVEDRERRGMAIDALLDWWRRRHLLSKAEWLRRRYLTRMLDEIAAVQGAVPF